MALTTRTSLLVPLALLFAAASGVVRMRRAARGRHSATAVDAAIASGMAVDELANAKGQEVVFGWKLGIVGDRARFFACTAEDACGERLVDVPAKSLLAVKVVGRGASDAR